MNDPRLRRFALIMAACYAVWYGVYDLWLLPDGRLDLWLSGKAAGWTTALLQTLGHDAVLRGQNEVWLGARGIALVAECNGLAVLSLFVGFVLAFPGRWTRRLWFIPMGIGIIVIANVARCAVLLGLLGRSQAAFNLGHGAGGLLFFYAIVFGLWMVWARVGGEAGT